MRRMNESVREFVVGLWAYGLGLRGESRIPQSVSSNTNGTGPTRARRQRECVVLRILVALMLLSSTMGLSCGGDDPVSSGAGTGSETVIGSVRTPEGHPAGSARVRVRPSSYLVDLTAAFGKRLDIAVSVIDTVTDSLGRYTLSELDTGEYKVEIFDDSGRAAQHVFRISGLEHAPITFTDTLRPMASIAVPVVLPVPSRMVYVQDYGLEHAGRTYLRGLSGFISLDSLPAGSHRLRLSTGSTGLAAVERTLGVAPGQAAIADTVVFQ
jgi:hypothetical protein